MDMPHYLGLGPGQPDARAVAPGESFRCVPSGVSLLAFEPGRDPADENGQIGPFECPVDLPA